MISICSVQSVSKSKWWVINFANLGDRARACDFVKVRVQLTRPLLTSPETHCCERHQPPRPEPGATYTTSLTRVLKMAEGGVKRTASPTRSISPPPLRRKVGSSINSERIWISHKLI